MDKYDMYRCLGKRQFDLILTLFGLFLMAPVLVLLGVLIRLKLGSPILFRQQRPG